MSGSELNQVCRAVISAQHSEYPLFEKAKLYLSGHPISFQEETTRLAILKVAMTGEYLKIDTKSFRGNKKAPCSASWTFHLRHLYQQIADRIGSETFMEKLNLVVRQQFFIVSVMASFTQGTMNNLIYRLTYRDIETCKQVFQLFVEHGHEVL